MRYSTLISAAVALSLFGLTAAQENCDVYTSADEYINDLPACPIGCWQWLVTYYETKSTCGNTVDLECLCATPEPDVTNSTVVGLYEGSYECMKTGCPETDNTKFAVAVSRFANTCAQMKANGTISTTPSATGAVETGTDTTDAPTGTEGPEATGSPATAGAPTATEAPVATNSPVFTDGASGFVTSAVPTGTAADVNASGSPTDTAVLAQQTVNAAGRNAISNWEMTLGLPLVAGLVVVQFL